MGYSKKATPLAVHFGVILTAQASDYAQTCGSVSHMNPFLIYPVSVSSSLPLNLELYTGNIMFNHDRELLFLLCKELL